MDKETTGVAAKLGDLLLYISQRIDGVFKALDKQLGEFEYCLLVSNEKHKIQGAVGSMDNTQIIQYLEDALERAKLASKEIAMVELKDDDDLNRKK
jgi:hypothetical protein